MPKFFVPQANISEKEIIIADKAQIHHLKNVLRRKPGDLIIIFDEAANEFTCNIRSFEKNKIIAYIKNIKKAVNLDKPKIILACAMPKKGKFDLIVEKTTELAVDEIIPLITERSIIKLDENCESKINRYQRIAQEASKQCGRLSIPVISKLIKLSKLAENFSSFDLILMPNLSSKSRINIFNASNLLKSKKNILILIGPEGDFTPGEVNLAKKSNAIMLSLGETTLKVETAAIICVGIISLLLTTNY
ncbi:MAG: RsmE family RNA methyltransferase [Candidatus Omnitrophota bacterium]